MSDIDEGSDLQKNYNLIQACKEKYNLTNVDKVDLIDNGQPTELHVAEKIYLCGQEMIIITHRPSDWKRIESEVNKLSDDGKVVFEKFFHDSKKIVSPIVSPQEYEKKIKELEGNELQTFIESQERTLSTKEIIEAIEVIRTKESNRDTFAIPSHPLMFSLLAMFAGKSERIPRELLEKPYSERTSEEKEKAEKYLSEIFESKKQIDYSEGSEKIIEKRIALICNNAKVESNAEITWSLFRNDIAFREERLAIYIKRTFGPEGIRHLLGLIIGLEENFRKGHFEWSVNEHLERLGYRKKAHGSFDPNLKKMASEIVKIFTGLCITSTRKDGTNGSIKAKFLFMVEGFEVQTFEKEIIDQRITLAATEFWYKNAFSPSDGQAPQYTKLLKEIVKENHREHPLTLYLTPLLAIFWRISPERKFKVRTLMEWCDLETQGKYKSERLCDLESTLEYMKKKNYLGEWNNSGESKYPSKCQDPYECILTFTPPEWLKNEFILIKERKENAAIGSEKIMSKTEFLTILNESGLNNKQFANCIGIAPQLVSAICNDKRPITKETSKKIREYQKSKIHKNPQNPPVLAEISCSLREDIHPS